MRSPKIGLLPLYIALYDQAMPEARKDAEAFYEQIAGALRKRGLEVATAPTCRLAPEFAAAVKGFEDAGADAIVTLHLAYSPSLESAAVLAGTPLPLIVLDTTPTYNFGANVDPAEIMGNHGIHGVQDMCNLLIRSGKAFQIEAGHWEKSDVLDRVAGWAKAAQLASAIQGARVGLVGEAFKGMGDFAVPFNVMQSTIGIETVLLDPKVLQSFVPLEDDPEVAKEMADDLEAFVVEDLDMDVHRRSVRAGLAIRRWIEAERLTALTVNFLVVDDSGLPTMPFLEISKAMARGIGYGGEGDVLTAGLRLPANLLHRDVLSRLGGRQRLHEPHGRDEPAPGGRQTAADEQGLPVEQRRAARGSRRLLQRRRRGADQPGAGPGRDLHAADLPRRDAQREKGPHEGHHPRLVQARPAAGRFPGRLQ